MDRALLLQRSRILGLFLILLLLSFNISAKDKGRIDSLLIELDNTIRNDNEFIKSKENRIAALKSTLNDGALADQKKYVIYENLTKEYEVYICDSAILYAQKSLRVATRLKKEDWIQESRISLASVQAKAGMFNEAIELLHSVDTTLLYHDHMSVYYKVCLDTYIYWLEYLEGHYDSAMLSSRRKYQRSLLHSLSENTYEYAINYGTRYIENNEFIKAEELLLSVLEKVKPNTRDYSIVTSLLSYLYERQNDVEKQKEYLALSSISDIKGSVKENISLRTLSLIMLEEGDVNRANRYIKKSMEDANFYNARLRNIQIVKLLPIIDQMYDAERESQQNKLRVLLWLVSILSVILILTIVLLLDKMKRLSFAQKEIVLFNKNLNELNLSLKKSNDKQMQVNKSLAEANFIKEQFIGSFLGMCTEYIQKLTNLKTTVNRKIKAGQVNDVLKITSSTKDITKESKDLYIHFDDTFLSIYPNFVEEINNLLRPEEQYPVTKDKTLNHELRVFALIKLGIIDSNQIATFLNYTLRTVYNYRSKVKSKAINTTEDFEERIKKIGLVVD